jgi:hypothetical protein
MIEDRLSILSQRWQRRSGLCSSNGENQSDMVSAIDPIGEVILWAINAGVQQKRAFRPDDPIRVMRRRRGHHARPFDRDQG